MGIIDAQGRSRGFENGFTRFRKVSGAIQGFEKDSEAFQEGTSD